LTDRNRATP